MRLSEKNRIILPILMIAFFVFSTFAWIYRFQNHHMGRIIETKQLLDQIREGMHEVNRTIQSGILTLDERYAVQTAKHSLRVFERLNAFEKLHPEDSAAIRRMYLDYYMKIVSINSLFLENRIEEGRARLAELEMNSLKMNSEIDKMIDLRISQYREAVRNINVFMALTSVIFSALLILISGLFMHYSKKRKEAEKALVEAEKMASLGTLSAGVAHEIRNPLAIILLGIEDLDASLATDPSRRDILGGIRQAVLRADRIIKGLLSFSQRPASLCDKLDVVPLLDEALLELKQREDENIRIETACASGLPKVRGDGDQLRQAFLNILVNAVESMPGGGTVGVVCRGTNANSLSITFSDTGTGIPGEERGKVLDPFYTTRQESGNVGLGLSIASGIVEGHGGTLKIESTLGRGTSVTVNLPVSE